MRRIFAVAAAALLAASPACAAELPDFDGATSEQPVETVDPTGAPPVPASTTTTEPPRFVPQELADLEIRPITIVDGDRLWVLTVAVADTPEEQSRGLMNVADLEDLDGMLFVWEEPTSTGFWMKDVILPLDIAFFGDDLAFVDSFTMPLCTTDDCPSYPAAGPFQYAVETLESTFADITPAATLILNP